MEPGVREQLRPHSGEVLRGDAADDGRGDRMVRTGGLLGCKLLSLQSIYALIDRNLQTYLTFSVDTSHFLHNFLHIIAEKHTYLDQPEQKKHVLISVVNKVQFKDPL